MPEQIRCFRLEHEDGKVVGYGSEFPNGRCYIQWERTAWPENERLDGCHFSDYDSMEDVETATNAEVVIAGPVTVA